MPFFRKKPVVIEAIQWNPTAENPAPGIHPAAQFNPWRNKWVIPTLEGEHDLTPGDWIITGVKGQHYPCKPDIFEMTYEPADAPETTEKERPQ